MPADILLFTYVNLCILKSLLKVVVDCLVGYLANQSEIRHPNFFFLRALEYRFPHLRLAASRAGSLRTACVFLAAGALCYCLRTSCVSKRLQTDENTQIVLELTIFPGDSAEGRSYNGNIGLFMQITWLKWSR